MAHPHSRLRWLFFRYWQNTCSAEERAEFLALAEKSENRTAISRLLEEVMEEPFDEQAMKPERAGEIFTAIVSKERPDRVAETGLQKSRLFSMKRMAVAASILLVVGIGVEQMFNFQKAAPVARVPQEAVPRTAVVPGHDGALLTLSDGTTIVLDSASNGRLAQEGAIKIEKQNGSIHYSGDGKTGQPVYNTIQTTKGNQYRVDLADGSKVWLNAASSIRFPAFFQKTERRVQITGEAYFEVAHNAAAPFKVDLNGMEITVLGTHFNVNAYSEEATVKTTLLEGAVWLANGKASRVLKPGQQATLNESGAFAIRSGVDLDEVVAWKNGVFIFNRQPLQSIMRQISRWYDVAVVYKGNSTTTFSGVVSRQDNISQVLKIMEANGVRFRMEGRTLTVLP